MKVSGWKTVPFETVVRSRGSGSAGLPQKEWEASGRFPVIGQGAEEIEGWTNREDLLLTPSPAVVLYGGHTRRAKHVSGPFVPGPNVKILQPRPELDSRFLFHFLTLLPIVSKGYADHFPQVRKCEISFPPLADQSRIVGILDEAFEGIAKAKVYAGQNARSAHALFRSQLDTVLCERGPGWGDKRLEELCIIGDGNHSSNYPKKDELVAEGVPFIRATNLVDGRICDEEMRFLSPRKHAQLKKGHLKAGDILFTNRGEIGRTAVVDEGHEGSNLNSQIAWLRCGKTLDHRFLFHVLNSGPIKSHLKLAANGAALQQFTIRQIKELRIPVPPKQQQGFLAETLDRLGEETSMLAGLYERKIAALELLGKSLLDQAFKGEL